MAQSGAERFDPLKSLWEKHVFVYFKQFAERFLFFTVVTALYSVLHKNKLFHNRTLSGSTGSFAAYVCYS